MDWTNERYVRLYTTDTLTWRFLGWEGQTVLMHLLRRCDRSGRIDLGMMTPTNGVVACSGLPREVVEQGWPRLLEAKVFVVEGDSILMPNFLEAQEAKRSAAQQKREERARKRDLTRGVGKSDGSSGEAGNEGASQGDRIRSDPGRSDRDVGQDDGGVGKHDHKSHAVRKPDEMSPLNSADPDPDPVPVPRDLGLARREPRPGARATTAFRIVPNSWNPNLSHIELAKSLGVSLKIEVAKFRDHEFARPKTDADKAFNNWLRRAAEQGPNGHGPSRKSGPALAEEPEDFDTSGDDFEAGLLR